VLVISTRRSTAFRAVTASACAGEPLRASASSL
jgi:hypothetical protein